MRIAFVKAGSAILEELQFCGAYIEKHLIIRFFSILVYSALALRMSDRTPGRSFHNADGDQVTL